MTITLDSLLQKVLKQNPHFSEERIRRAYDFAENAHKNQTRCSGEAYITHPLSVASILADFHPDEESLIAALLHDVSEDTERNLQEIDSLFGQNVRELVWGLEKLRKIKSKTDIINAENLRKLFFAMSKDFRVVLIKLCDRLHNMRTLASMSREKQKRISEETLNIYAPIASRLGIYILKGELEDLSFSYFNPEAYLDIQEQLGRSAEWRKEYIGTAREILSKLLSQEGIHGTVEGRVKGYYSIHRKMKKKGRTNLDEIFDIFAMRIILPDILRYEREYLGHVYAVLGTIHNHFTPLAQRFKDYIAVPKLNGYRSLHTAVVGLGPKTYIQPMEIQIRTQAMHEQAEYGIASHWIYEDSGKSGTAFLEWLAGLQKMQLDLKSDQEFLEHLKVDLFQDRIFVLTPRGDVKDLPKGATPVDFAYAVHSEVGDHSTAARVNGNMVPLNYELKNGEVVEIFVRKNMTPSHDWLSFVKTNNAKARIRAWFRSLNRDKHLKEGKRLLNEKLTELGKLPLDQNLSVLRAFEGKKLSFGEREDLLTDIGKGTYLPGAVIRKLFSLQELLGRKSKKEEKILIQPKEKGARDIRFSIGMQKDIPHQFAQCCRSEKEGHDDLVGFITRGKGVKIHRRTCAMVSRSDAKRFIEVFRVEKPYLVTLCAEMIDRIGLLGDLGKVFAQFEVNIVNHGIREREGDLVFHEFHIEVKDFDQLDRVLNGLKNVPNVRRVFKVK